MKVGGGCGRMRGGCGGLRVGRALVVLALSAPLLIACGGADAGTGGGPRIVASFYPLEYVAQRVASDHADVVNLTSPGVEPHDLELSVTQTAEIEDAQIAFYQEGFQPAVDEAIDQNDPEHVVDATRVVTLQPPDDPHFWLDPARLSTVAVAFEKVLADADAEHAAAYAKNLRVLQSDLAELDRSYRTGLASCDIDTVVVSHDAFGYLRKYDLDLVAINGLSPDAEPSPSHIADLQDLVSSEGISTVFSETLASPELAETLADDLGIGTGVLDPIEGLSETTAEEDYLSLMRANLAALQEANHCS